MKGGLDLGCKWHELRKSSGDRKTRNTMKLENRVCSHPDLCGNRSQLQQKKVKLWEFNFHLDPSLVVLIIENHAKLYVHLEYVQMFSLILKGHSAGTICLVP